MFHQDFVNKNEKIQNELLLFIVNEDKIEENLIDFNNPQE